MEATSRFIKLVSEINVTSLMAIEWFTSRFAWVSRGNELSTSARWRVTLFWSWWKH